MTLWSWWRGRSEAARFDLSVRASFYGNFALVPALAFPSFAPEIGAAAWLVVPLLAAHSVLCLLLVRAGLAHGLDHGPRPAGLLAATAALTVAGSAAGYLAFPDPAASGVLTAMAGCFVVALSTAVPLRVTVAVVAGTCAAAYLLSQLRGAPAADTVAVLTVVLVVVSLAGRLSTWMLAVVWQLDRARRVQASVAVAEERVRFARDLHDVVGRTLSVVALKAELAAQLARRGQPAAVDEMLEVHRVAQDSLTELRAVVGGYRSADLEAELAGARSLLAAAGIRCEVAGDGAGLPAPVHGALGWAVREGATNMLRHSDARECAITLRASPAGTVTLTMENDGVRDTPPGGRVPFGGGLIGLAERIAGLGGTVTADRDQDRFRLAVELPADQEGVARR